MWASDLGSFSVRGGGAYVHVQGEHMGGILQYIMYIKEIQWNSSKADTTGTKNFVRCSEVSLAQELVVDHGPGPLLQLRPAMIKYTTVDDDKAK